MGECRNSVCEGVLLTFFFKFTTNEIQVVMAYQRSLPNLWQRSMGFFGLIVRRNWEYLQKNLMYDLVSQLA